MSQNPIHCSELVIHTRAESIVQGDLAPDTVSGMDMSIASPTFDGTFMVPMPLLLLQFGMYISETPAATSLAQIILERVPGVEGSATTVVTVDLDEVAYAKGNNLKASVTASTGSEDILIDNELFAPRSLFPILVAAPQYLQVRNSTASGGVGEIVPFIVYQWQGIDLRPTTIWQVDA